MTVLMNNLFWRGKKINNYIRGSTTFIFCLRCFCRNLILPQGSFCACFDIIIFLTNLIQQQRVEKWRKCNKSRNEELTRKKSFKGKEK